MGIKAQSTLEMAIVIGLVAAVAVGVAQSVLKTGLRRKTAEGLDFFSKIGTGEIATVERDMPGGTHATDTPRYAGGPIQDRVEMSEMPIYEQNVSLSAVDAASYRDKSMYYKGGAERKFQRQRVNTVSIESEALSNVNDD